MRDIKIVALEPERISQAFPLVQTAVPRLDLEAWQRFAMTRLEPPPPASGGSRECGGILAAENECGTFVGLIAYRFVCDLRHGPVLMVDQLLAVDLLDSALIARRLAAELDALAHRHGCSAIHTTLIEPPASEDGSWLLGLLKGQGHEVKGLALCKQVRPSIGARSAGP